MVVNRKRIMTLAKLADYLDVPRNSLRLLAETEGCDRFPAVKIGSKWCADVAEVQEWLLKMCERREH